MGDGATVLLADVDQTRGPETADRLTTAGPGRASFVALDVRDADAVQDAVDAAVRDHGRLDLIFNNAGIGVGGRSEDLDLAHWDRAIDINLRGVIHGVHAALPHMLATGRGQIVNTASLAGLIPSALMAPYTATKHAVVGMTLAMRLEYARRGVGFTVVCPGFTDTGILDSRGPVDLRSIDSQPDIRSFAQSLPGGIYAVEALAQDICTGMQNNEAMIVAPDSARATWQAWRDDPEHYLSTLSGSATVPRSGSNEAEG